ncbi:hypothetical protein NP233_g5953 [Leucocoprinus birnbaumii]|uniref:Glycine cleavage system H protein n=1 Tax=Leucocoprinus birnbaumii TaxID=56174 RepID=A0AAD5YQG5_9AGAR|nr:hypothetical protein NP233_g5953 [Leucocoprinus birnbaumii]
MQAIFRNAARARPSSLAFRTSNVNRVVRATPSIRTLITKRYTEEHETIIFDDETKVGTVTLTDYAQKTLGDVVFVELPTPGSQLAQGDHIGAVESVKAASEIYSPVSGTVKEVNTALAEQPGLLNKSPEQDGWLCKIELSDPSEVEKLLEEEEYTKLIS